MRILVVEDDELLGESLGFHFSEAYPNVVAKFCSCSVKALTTLEEFRPHVVILDCPPLSTVPEAVVNRINNLDKRPVIVLMASTQLKSPIFTRYQVLQKPFSLDELDEIIIHLLE